MKNVLFIFTLSLLAFAAHAKLKKQHVVASFQLKVNSISYASPSEGRSNLKLGLPTFSYQAGLEHKFSIHKKLNFSLQYAMHYSMLNQMRANEINYYIKNKDKALGLNLQFNANRKVGKQNSVKAGLGVNQSILQPEFEFQNKEVSQQKIKTIPASGFNPYLMIGIERNMKWFNKQLYYSIEYNLGFFPLTQKMQVFAPSGYNLFNQGLVIGLKYKL